MSMEAIAVSRRSRAGHIRLSEDNNDRAGAWPCLALDCYCSSVTCSARLTVSGQPAVLQDPAGQLKQCC
jgi:hypothetical protein